MSVGLVEHGLTPDQVGTKAGTTTTTGGTRATTREARVAMVRKTEVMQEETGPDQEDTPTLSPLVLPPGDLGAQVCIRTTDLRKRVLPQFSPNSLQL